MRTLYRFEKPGGHRVEIRDRTVMQFSAIEFLVFVDGSPSGAATTSAGTDVATSAENCGRILTDWIEV